MGIFLVITDFWEEECASYWSHSQSVAFSTFHTSACVLKLHPCVPASVGSWRWDTIGKADVAKARLSDCQ